MKIWKYEVPDKPIFSLSMPDGAQILSLQMQGRPVMWAALEDEDEEKLEERHFFIIGTGHQFDGSHSLHIGTFQDAFGLVWHVFERLPR